MRAGPGASSAARDDDDDEEDDEDDEEEDGGIGIDVLPMDVCGIGIDVLLKRMSPPLPLPFPATSSSPYTSPPDAPDALCASSLNNGSHSLSFSLRASTGLT